MTSTVTFAVAAPSSPSQLVAAYKANDAAKDCAAQLALFDFTNATESERKSAKSVACMFEPPLADVRFVPLKPGAAQPVSSGLATVCHYNLPIVGEIEMMAKGESFYGTSLYVGQKDGNYYIASLMTAEAEKAEQAGAAGAPLQGKPVPSDAALPGRTPHVR